jgi:hypothetical protein
MLWIAVALAQEATVGGGGEVDVNLNYVWRGLVFSDGPVIQPYASIWFLDGEFSLWASQALLPSDETAIFELDPAFVWTFYAGPLELTPGLTGYLYPTSFGDSSLEGALTVAYPVGIFSIYTAHNFDLLAAPGAWYGTLGASLEAELPASLWVGSKLEFALASSTYNDFYLGVKKTGLETVGLGAEVGWAPNAFYARIHGETAYWFDSELAEASGQALPVNVGLAVGFEL